jgi:hypothetical protein
MFRFVFFAALLIFGLAMAKLTTSVADRGDHESEIDTVRSTPVERIARTGLNDSETLDAWIEQEFYVGRFDVSWSASDIKDGVNAGKVRVTADMRSESQLQLEHSIVLRFDVDPKDKKVTFAGMVLEGAEVAAASGKPYSLEEAMTTMWEHRSETYGLDPSDDSDS